MLMIGIPWPLGPWIVATSGNWWPWKQLKIDNGLRAMAHCRTNAIISSITTADDNNILSFGVDVTPILQVGIQE
jgi:hypothetical protein